MLMLVDGMRFGWATKAASMSSENENGIEEYKADSLRCHQIIEAASQSAAEALARDQTNEIFRNWLLL